MCVSVDGDDFTIIKNQIYLARQTPIMISVLSPELIYHLRIFNFGQFVILARYLEFNMVEFSPYFPNM